MNKPKRFHSLFKHFWPNWYRLIMKKLLKIEELFEKIKLSINYQLRGKQRRGRLSSLNVSVKTGVRSRSSAFVSQMTATSGSSSIPEASREGSGSRVNWESRWVKFRRTLGTSTSSNSDRFHCDSSGSGWTHGGSLMRTLTTATALRLGVPWSLATTRRLYSVSNYSN